MQNTPMTLADRVAARTRERMTLKHEHAEALAILRELVATDSLWRLGPGGMAGKDTELAGRAMEVVRRAGRVTS